MSGKENKKETMSDVAKRKGAVQVDFSEVFPASKGYRKNIKPSNNPEK